MQECEEGLAIALFGTVLENRLAKYEFYRIHYLFKQALPLHFKEKVNTIIKQKNLFYGIRKLSRSRKTNA